MEIKRGIAVSPGVAIYPPLVLDAEEYSIPRKNVPPTEIPAELEALTRAFDASLAEVTAVRDATALQLGKDVAAIFDFHYGILNQSHLRDKIANLVKERSYSAAYAVRETLRNDQRRFRAMKDRILSERYRDVQDIERRLLRQLCGSSGQELAELREPAIVIAHDLTPSQSANLVQTKIKGVAMDAGGLTSHTAIVVRSMGIPAVMGLKDITTSVSAEDTVILDGTKGLVIIRPDEETLAEYRAEAERMEAAAIELIELRDKPAVTQDGLRITLLSNIEFPYEAQSSLEKGAEGIGLYRRVPVSAQRGRTHRRRALRRLSPGGPGGGRAAGDHPHPGPRRGQIYPGSVARSGTQSLPRLALDPLLPAKSGAVQGPVAGHFAGLGRGGRPGDVPPDFQPHGASAGQNGPG